MRLAARSVLSIVFLVAAMMATVVVAHRPAGATPATSTVLAEGQTIQVDGASIGCKVIRRGLELYLDCRRAGPAEGTYGAMLGERKAMIVKFRSSRSAKVIFTANHRGKARTCR